MGDCLEFQRGSALDDHWGAEVENDDKERDDDTHCLKEHRNPFHLDLERDIHRGRESDVKQVD